MSGSPERLRAAVERLAATSDSARLDVELLAAHSLGLEREAWLLDRSRLLPEAFEALVERRAWGEPIAYIVGRRGFWTIDVAVGPGVLVPRPDSETLIEVAVAHFAGTDGPGRVLDLGTGPGTLLLAALDQWPEATGLGVEASETALGFARSNAARLGFDARAEFRAGDWDEGIGERFDLVLCNPPYIAEGDPELAADVAAHEPREALIAGADGLDDYRRIVPALPRLLAAGGLAVLEIGHRQGAAVSALVEAAGLAPRIARDLGGRDRVVAAVQR